MTEYALTAANLQRFLDAVVPDRAGVVTAVTPITGGYSRDTAIGDVTWGSGDTERVVLRADPPAGTGVFMSDRDREWSLICALQHTGPATIPTPLWYDEHGEHFGTKCFVSEFYPSRSLQDIARAGDIDGARDMFVDTIAGVHATPLAALPADLEHPADWDGYLDSLIDLLDSYSRTSHDGRPALRYAATRLRSFRPEPVPLSLVHGDCQPSNVLLGADGVRVIDWEFGRIGDPREDIGYYTQMPIPPNLYTTNPAAFLARYRERTGMTESQLNQDTVDFFLLLGLARLYGQEMEGADAVAAGESRGVMATYLINAVTNSYGDYYTLARRIAAGAGAR